MNVPRPACLHGAFLLRDPTYAAASLPQPKKVLTTTFPQEVHISQIGTRELKKAPGLHKSQARLLEREEKVRKAAGVKTHVFKI